MLLLRVCLVAALHSSLLVLASSDDPLPSVELLPSDDEDVDDAGTDDDGDADAIEDDDDGDADAVEGDDAEADAVAEVASPDMNTSVLPCGLVQADGSVVLRQMDTCDHLVLTNCTTLTEAAVALCPDECPFLEQSAFGSCGAACVTADGCGAYRPEHGLANTEDRLCQECPVLGCAKCNMTHCFRCHRGHSLSDDGLTCDNWRRAWSARIFGILGIILGVAGLVALGLGCAWNCNPHPLQLGHQHRRRCMPHKVESTAIEGPSPADAIYRAKSSLYSLSVNVHRRNILGVGFALYYNHLVFVACFAALAFFVLLLADVMPQDRMRTSAASCGYSGDELLIASQASYAWSRFLLSLTLWAILLAFSLGFVRWQVKAARAFEINNKHMKDYVILAKGFPAEATDPNEIQSWLESLLGRAIVGVSIAYDFRGHDDEVRRLLDEHLTRRDLAFNQAIGIPMAAAALARDPTSPTASKRPSRPRGEELTAMTPKMSAAAQAVEGQEGMEAFEDFCKQWISDMATDPLTQEGREMFPDGGQARSALLPGQSKKPPDLQDLTPSARAAEVKPEEGVTESMERGSGDGEQERDPQALLRSFRNSGEAFVVCHREGDVQDLFALWGSRERSQLLDFSKLLGGQGRISMVAPEVGGPMPLAPQYRTFHGCSITLSEISSEPTSIVWHHFGTSKATVARRGVIAVLLFLLVLVAFNLILYFPVTQFVLRYAQDGGEGATFWQTAALGVVVGVESNIIQGLILLGVPQLGFKRKEQSDSTTFIFGTLLVLSNTLAVVLYTAQHIAAASRPEAGILSGAGHVLEQSEKVGEQMALTQAMSRLFVTGTFIVPSLSYFLSYPLLFWLAIFVIRTGFKGPWVANAGKAVSLRAELTDRQAEHLMTPMEVWLPWDYGNHIQLPSCALAMLFLPEADGSSSARILCLLVVVWSFVMYCAQRVIHLRASKETFFTTGRLDTTVLLAWGPLPLSLLPLLSVYWMGRATDVSGWLVCLLLPVMFASSCILYWIPVVLILAARQAAPPRLDPYELTLSELRYSYFNTNPIYVLASELLPELQLPRTTWYEAGKAYLQTKDPRGEARLEAARTAAELAPEPGESQQGFLRHMIHRAKVWVMGEPPQGYYDTLDQVDDEVVPPGRAR